MKEIGVSLLVYVNFSLQLYINVYDCMSGEEQCKSHSMVHQPSESDQADLDSNEIWCTCWSWWFNTISQILGKLEQEFGSYSLWNFDFFGKKGAQASSFELL